MTLAKVKEQDGMMLAKVKEQDGMILAKVKEQDGMVLAKVKEQLRWDDACKSEGCKSPKYPYISGLLRWRATDICIILFLYLLQPSITYRTMSSKPQIPLVIYNCQLLHRTASSKHRYL